MKKHFLGKLGGFLFTALKSNIFYYLCPVAKVPGYITISRNVEGAKLLPDVVGFSSAPLLKAES